MSRLTERKSNGDIVVDGEYIFHPHTLWFNIADKLAHYEDLEEQRSLIEQKHERWVYRPDNDGCDYECSNPYCQCRISYNGSKVSGDFNYCPNCGAKMEE